MVEQKSTKYCVKGEFTMPNMELLNQKIIDSGIPKTTICKRSGIERATLYNRLNGNGDWRISEFMAISEVLRLTKSEINEIFLS